MSEHSIALADNLTCYYEIIPSTRAKYLRIKLMPDGGVKVILPIGVKEKAAHAFVLTQEQWLHKHLLLIRKRPVQPVVRPDELFLASLDERWKICYEAGDKSGVSVVETDRFELIVTGNIDALEVVFKRLGEWLKYKAQRIFPDMLDKVAKTYHFDYGRVTIRGQKTRWGSCSSKGNISLNYKLLFFPEGTARYVLIHELCHTRELNHSKQFWMHVAKCDPEYKQHEKMLKQARDYVPAGF